MAAVKCILVVDDDPDLRDAVSDLLASEGYHVRQASNGEEALALLRAQKVDLAIVDMRMPVKSGWDMLKELRETAGLAELPVIVLSADLVLPLSGTSRCLRKPIDPNALLAVIGDMLPRSAVA